MEWNRINLLLKFYWNIFVKTLLKHRKWWNDINKIIIGISFEKNYFEIEFIYCNKMVFKNKIYELDKLFKCKSC